MPCLDAGSPCKRLLPCDQGVTGWSEELLRSCHQRSKALANREKHWRAIQNKTTNSYVIEIIM